MAIFNEAYLTEFLYKKKNSSRKSNTVKSTYRYVGKTVYKPDPYKYSTIGEVITTSFKQIFFTAKEACALAIEDAFNIDYPESDNIKISNNKKNNLKKKYSIYKAVIIDEGVKIKYQSEEFGGTIEQLAEKYGFTIEIDD